MAVKTENKATLRDRALCHLPALFCLVIFIHFTGIGAGSSTGNLIKGADVSFLQQIEDNGGIFRDHGEKKDALDIFRNHGVNYIRLRIWHTPAGWYNGLDKTLLMASRIKQKKMKLLLDFHFSQTWADPGHQTPPPEWNGLAFPDLVDSIYQYTRSVVAALNAQQTPPDLIQLGNEITCGLLWNYGNVCNAFNTGAQWQQLSSLLQAAGNGARDALSPGNPARIIIHTDQSGDPAGAIWFFDSLTAHQVSFDIIGLSYYSWWHTRDLNVVAHTFDTLATRYQKDILVAETAYPWTLQWNDSVTNMVGSAGQLIDGYPPSVDGQKQFLLALMQLIRDIPGNHGIGLCYWEPDWIVAPTFGSAWENLALFDFNGNALSSLSAFEPDITTTYPPGWNLVSAPLIPADRSVESLLPFSTGAVFGYEETYSPVDSIRNGEGYWVNLPESITVTFHGEYITGDTIMVRRSWNLIGPYDYPVAAKDIVPVPPESILSPVFGQTLSGPGGYFVTDTLQPGRSYWIKAGQNGRLVLQGMR